MQCYNPRRMRPLHTPLPLALLLLLAGIFLLSTGGHTYASDEEQMLAVAEGLATGRGFNLAGLGQPPRYSNYGPGQPIVALPLYVAGRALAAAFPPEGAALLIRAAVSWLNPLVTAATGSLIALAALRLGYTRRAAAATALIYGLATFAWPHSKTFFAEPLAAMLTFASVVVVLGVSRFDSPRTLMALFGSGLLAALACAVKLQAGLALPFLGLWVLWRAAGRPGMLGRLAPAFAWGLGALLGLGLLGAYQWALFGSPLRSGYGGAGGVFAGSLAEGLYGLTLSPGKGLIWYAPPLALLPAGLALLGRRDRGVALLCGSLASATVLLYTRVIFWHGDGAWGPRYLNMALPLMVLPLVALIDAGLAPRPGAGRAAARLALTLTLLLAIPVQLGGVLINLNAYLGVQRDAGRRYFEPSQSPIVGHLRLAWRQFAHSYALRVAPGTLALAQGFSYSEGDRASADPQQAQLPRWTEPRARLDLRPPPGARSLWVALRLSGCLPAPLPPAEVALTRGAGQLTREAPCPPRAYRLLLPPERATLTLSSPGWQPAEAGIARDGPLGLYLTEARAWTDEAPLTLVGRLVPIPPAPAGPVALRQWSSDYRYGHWDLWAWYLAHSGLPAAPSWTLALGWAGVGLALALTGGLAVRGHLHHADAVAADAEHPLEQGSI